MSTIADPHLFDEIREALVAYYDHPTPWPEPTDASDVSAAKTRRRAAQHDRARKLVNQALAHGLTMRRIASHTQLPGKLIIPLIDDLQARADAYAAELHHLERAMEEIRAMRATEARQRHRAGEKKTALAASYRVTRVTLDKWLDDTDA